MSNFLNILFIMFFLSYGAYSLVLGWMNLRYDKKILDITSILTLLWIRVTKGADAAERLRLEIIESKHFKTIARYSLLAGGLGLFLAIIVGMEIIWP